MPDENLQTLKTCIEDMNEDDQRRIDIAAHVLRSILEMHGEHGLMAFALVGAELDAQGDHPCAT
jgi:hypothetical protein